jgi:hypothetical protein
MARSTARNDRSSAPSAVQRRIHSMETSLLYRNERSLSLSGEHGALVTKARVFPDALQNELNAIKMRRAGSLRQRRNFDLAINTEAAKLLKPAGDVVRLRKSNADAIDKLVTLVRDLRHAAPPPGGGLAFSPIHVERQREKPPDLSPMLPLPLPLAGLPSYRSTGRQQAQLAQVATTRRTLGTHRAMVPTKSVVAESSQSEQKASSRDQSRGLLQGLGFFKQSSSSPLPSDTRSRQRSSLRRSSASFSGSEKLSAARRLSHSGSFCGVVGRHQQARSLSRSPSVGSSATLSHSDLRAERT